MEIQKINNNILQYSFTNEKSEFSFNITTLIEGDTAILIDVAYKKYATQVKDHLIEKGISDFIVFISHHHEDHFDGCKIFKDSMTFGSELFEKDFQEHLQPDDFLNSFRPTNHFQNDGIYKTKNFVIDFLYTPGHNICEFSFFVNKKYLYAGDLIFYNKIGLPSLPYIDTNSKISDYIDSLLKIQSLDPQFLLLGHGQYLNSKSEINRQIEDRLFYLKKIQSVGNKLSLDDCLRLEKTKYSGLNFHQSNLNKKL